MSPSRPSLRIRPRSAIVDADIARIAVTDLPRHAVAPRDLRPRSILRAIRSLGRPLEPERVIVVAVPATTPAPALGRRDR